MAIFVKKDSGDPKTNIDFFNRAMEVGDMPNAETAMTTEELNELEILKQASELGDMEDIEEEERKETLREKLNNLDKEDYKGYLEMYEAAGLNLKQKAYLNHLIDNRRLKEAYKYLQSKQKQVEED